MLDAVGTLELARKPHSLYLRSLPLKKPNSSKWVLSNCAIDAASVYPTYRKPFDVIFQRAKNEEWRALRDSNPRPSGS